MDGSGGLPDKAARGRIAYYGLTEIVRLLVAAGANVNCADGGEWTALIMAACFGLTDIVRPLVTAGADVNHVDDGGRTALIWAAEGGHTEIARLLVDAGADVNRASKLKQTALMRAASFGFTETARLLVAAGAGVDHEDYCGCTALGMVRGRNCRLKALLEDHKPPPPPLWLLAVRACRSHAITLDSWLLHAVLDKNIIHRKKGRPHIVLANGRRLDVGDDFGDRDVGPGDTDDVGSSDTDDVGSSDTDDVGPSDADVDYDAHSNDAFDFNYSFG